MSPRQIFLLLIGLAVALETIADIILKQWAIKSNHVLLMIGAILYLVGSGFWIFSLRYEGIAKAASIFTVLNLVALVLAGVLFFQEELSILNKFGIILGIASVILIEL